MSWEKVKLSELAEVIAGQSPESKYYNSKGTGMPFFQGKADFGVEFPTVRYWTTKQTKVAEPLDVLFSVRAPVGPTNICNIKSCIGRGLAAIRVGKNLNYRYLHFYLKSIEHLIANEGNGSTFSAITTSVLKDLQIPLPPLSIQQRIAEILDAADALKRKDQELLKKYDELAQAIFIDMFGDPVRNEKGWGKVKGSVHYEVRGRVGWKGYKKTDLRESGSLVLGATHVDEIGNIDVTKAVYLSEEKFLESPEIMIEQGDIIFVQRGNTIGKAGLINKDIGKATINPVVLILRAKNSNPLFLLHLILHKSIKSQLAATNNGSAQPMITQKTMNEYEMINPDIDLQNSFAQKISNINIQRESIYQSRQKTEFLFNSLIQNAFKGELVS